MTSVVDIIDFRVRNSDARVAFPRCFIRGNTHRVAAYSNMAIKSSTAALPGDGDMAYAAMGGLAYHWNALWAVQGVPKGTAPVMSWGRSGDFKRKKGKDISDAVFAGDEAT